MTGQARFPSDAKAFSKAFLARTPKKSVGEVVDAEASRDSNRIVDSVKLSPSKYNARAKKDALAAAKGILGGEPGEGGLGTMKYVGLHLPKDLQKRSNDSLSAEKSRVDEAHKTVSSSSTSSTTSSRFINNMKDSKSPRIRASVTSLSSVARSSGQVLASVSTAMNSPKLDPIEVASSDTYSDFNLAQELPGNAEAKRKEVEAMALINRMDSITLAPDKTEDSPVENLLDSDEGCDTTNNDISTYGRSTTANNEETEECEIEYATTDDEESHRSLAMDAVIPSKALRSPRSDSSIVSHLERPHTSFSPSGSSFPDHDTSAFDVEDDSISDGAYLGISHTSVTERGRSGTIIAARGPRQDGSSTQRTDEARVIDHAAAPQSPRTAQAFLGDQLDSSNDKERHSSSRIGSRIAGIQFDEISSWKDAKHAMSKYYSIHSFSNGHMLEDWRTVISFRLRPFELLEIQYVDAQKRIHLPRGIANRARSSSTTRRSSPTRSSEILSSDNDRYTEQYSEGWCYIYKRNSGTSSKAQRAGLGVWKLRYIVVCGSKLTVFRKRPIQRASISDAQNAIVWNLSLTTCVFSERADGVTRPALRKAVEGHYSEIITLSFHPSMAPASHVNSETTGWVPPTVVSLSMRFITQADFKAFFNTFARAHLMAGEAKHSGIAINEWRKEAITRATIAGRGGVVLPGRAGRRGGRNALARSRLRLPGVSRDFDDADRWSSTSENEDHNKVTKEHGFKYADVYANNTSSTSGQGGDTTAEAFDSTMNLDLFRATTATTITTLNSPAKSASLDLFKVAPDRELVGAQMANVHRDAPRNNWEPTTTISELNSSLHPSMVDANSIRSRRSGGFSFAKTARRIFSSPKDPIQAGDTFDSPITPTNDTFEVHRRSNRRESFNRELKDPQARHSYRASSSPVRLQEQPLWNPSGTSDLGDSQRSDQTSPKFPSSRPMITSRRSRSHTIAASSPQHQ
ncbi:hypothetical protein CBS101457_000534 [Exobasidium rhododendri]|nr:hypothetical protein CBS101457_000534 [Exobasidium rhododendri]